MRFNELQNQLVYINPCDGSSNVKYRIQVRFFYPLKTGYLGDGGMRG
jgi:hypothetical protein